MGKAKVMSYEGLEEARKKRAMKETAKTTTGEGKRGRKRKCPEPEPDSEQGQEVEAGPSVPVWKAKATRLTDVIELAKAPRAMKGTSSKDVLG